jgi:hypothetical protein
VGFKKGDPKPAIVGTLIRGTGRGNIKLLGVIFSYRIGRITTDLPDSSKCHSQGEFMFLGVPGIT